MDVVGYCDVVVGNTDGQVEQKWAGGTANGSCELDAKKCTPYGRQRHAMVPCMWLDLVTLLLGTQMDRRNKWAGGTANGSCELDAKKCTPYGRQRDPLTFRGTFAEVRSAETVPRQPARAVVKKKKKYLISGQSILGQIVLETC